MKKTNYNLVLLSMIFGITLIVSNITTGKLFATGLTIFNNPIVLPGAVFCYAITFLMTDVIGEIWGRKEANQVVKFGMIGQILATILIIATQKLPAVDPEMQNAYNMLLGQNWIIVLGSLTAYITSQSCDVHIFHKIRDKYIAKNGTTKGGKWIWNNISTMTSQVIDTVVFSVIVFGFGFGWFFNKDMWGIMATMMLGQYIFKFLLAAIDTPIFYILTKNSEKN